jgi:hypothetical protein
MLRWSSYALVVLVLLACPQEPSLTSDTEVGSGSTDTTLGGDEHDVSDGDRNE